MRINIVCTGAIAASRAYRSALFVLYFRFSTDRQGASGLGLEAQRSAVSVFLNGGDWNAAAEFVEIESQEQ